MVILAALLCAMIFWVDSIPSGVVASAATSNDLSMNQHSRSMSSLRRFVSKSPKPPAGGGDPTHCASSIDVSGSVPHDTCTIFLSALNPFGGQKSTCCDDPTDPNYGTCETSSNCNGMAFMACNGGNCPNLNSPKSAPRILCKVKNPAACTQKGDKCWGTVSCPNGPCPAGQFSAITPGMVCISDGSGANNIPDTNGFLSGQVKICGACAQPETGCPPDALGVTMALTGVTLSVTDPAGNVYPLIITPVWDGLNQFFYVAWIGDHAVDGGNILFTPSYTTAGEFRYSVNFGTYFYDSPSGVQITAPLKEGSNLIQIDVIQNPLCGDYIAEYSITIYQGPPPP